MYRRSEYIDLKIRIQEPRKFIQALTGPRQIGKTTMVKDLIQELPIQVTYISADNTGGTDQLWLMQQWERARMMMRPDQESLLIIDEIQKIHNWSEQVKQLWDEDSMAGRPLKIILTGSASLLLQQGLTESLAGRFEVIKAGHWRFEEMEAAFGTTVEEFVWFGGYPGTASLFNDEDRFREYVKNALIESTISRDILMLSRVEKPALLKRLFELGSAYSSQILSYSKMVGQLQDAGNTTTLSHYLSLLDQAGMICGLEKIYGEPVRAKSSSPKIQVKNAAFISALSTERFEDVRINPERWGRLIESAIGAHLIHYADKGHFQLLYWKERDYEVDFVLKRGSKIIGLEVKSGAAKRTSGMMAFKHKFKPDKVLLAGLSGIHWREFLRLDPTTFF